MNIVNLKINEEDIKRYLRLNKEKYSGKEVLFLEYLKENENTITKEAIEILLEKNYYCLINENEGSIIADINDILPCFNLENNKKDKELNARRISDILIPAFKYYGSNVISINRFYTTLNVITKCFNINNDKSLDVIKQAISDYEILNMVNKNADLITIKMSKEKCRIELKEYSSYYDSDKVKIIRKIVRNGDFMYV